MGQKVNPHGFRVGVIKDWDTRWFANGKAFADNLISDYEIREFLKKKLYAAGIAKIEIERAAGKITVNIHTAKPGIVIGRGGAGVEAVSYTHLDVYKRQIVDRLLREFKVEANIGNPQVSYREAITKKVRQESKYARQSGGRGQYGHCIVEFEPLEPGSGYEFVNATVGGSIPKEYIAPIDQGIREAAQSGVLAGYEVMDFRATVVDGSYHEVDSSEMAFKIAGSMAFKEGMAKAGPVLLEPMMKTEIVIPEEYMGDVMGNLTARRGRIEGMEARGNGQVIRAMVPLSEMFG